MRIAPSLLAALAALAFPAAALAVPPGNDNYLASVPIETSPFEVTVDTTEATTQTDTYNPNREGVPFSRSCQLWRSVIGGATSMVSPDVSYYDANSNS